MKLTTYYFANNYKCTIDVIIMPFHDHVCTEVCFFSFYHAGVILHLPCVSETSRLVSSVACSNDSFELFLTSLLFLRTVCLKFYFISASEKEHQRPCMHLMSSEHVTLQKEGRDICDVLVFILL